MSQDVFPPRSPEQSAPMRAAAEQTGSGPVGVVGPVLAVLLLAAGVVLLRDALVAGGAVAGSPWLTAAVEGVRGFAPAAWLVPVGVVVALIGVWLLVTALRRRSRRTLPLTSRTGVFVHTRDLARLASGAARDVDGVLSASSSATRRTVEVRVEGTAEAGLREAVTAAVDERLSALQEPPRTRVRVRAAQDVTQDVVRSEENR